MPAVDSSALTAMEYDAKTQILTVTAKENGQDYRYAAVPQAVYNEFLGSPSKGRYWNLHIKPRYRLL